MMTDKNQKRISKFLSLVLRHDPAKIGIELDEAGWVSVETLLSQLAVHKKTISRDELESVVAGNDKQRFEFSSDRKRIRARQGHSVDVELGYQPVEPPEFLLHGTPEKFVESILKTGLQKQNRHHVHLHEQLSTAKQAGGRRGKPVMLRIRAQEMHAQGFVFFVSENHVWLTDHVPPNFIEVLNDNS